MATTKKKPASKKKTATKKAVKKKVSKKKTAKKKTTTKATPKKAATKKAPKKTAKKVPYLPIFEAVVVNGPATKLVSFTEAGEFIAFLNEYMDALIQGKDIGQILEVGLPTGMDKKTDVIVRQAIRKLTEAYEQS